MLEAIGQFLKILFFLLNLWGERDLKKAAEKKVIAKEMLDAISETDKKLQASRINAAIGRANRM